MVLKHPYGAWLPRVCENLLIGSFPGKEVFDPKMSGIYNWFYMTKRNQFWPIMEQVYHRDLKNLEAKMQLCTELKLGITDVILACERTHATNLDSNLKIVAYNTHMLEHIFATQPLKKIYFSSRFVETLFKRHFKDLFTSYAHLHYVTLPTPSPRYSVLRMQQKAEIFARELPAIG